jgi:hypothetical protein
MGSVTQILVGLVRVGIVGLREALEKVDAAGVRGRDEVAALMLELLRPDNFIPEERLEAYRTAFWREYLRRKGQDFSAYYSEVPVMVRGGAGKARDEFVALVGAILARDELRPAVTYGDEGLADLELVIRGETVARSSEGRQRLETAIRRSISDW